MSATGTSTAEHLAVATSLLERADQLAVLVGAIADLSVGTGSVMLIGGGLGAGRSALLDALTEAARLAGVWWRAARATRSEQSLPFGIAHRLRDTDRALPAARRDSTASPGPQQQPIVVVVDDLQWADDLSLAWLSRLCDLSAQAPVLLAFAVLDGDPQGERPAVRDLCRRAHRTLRASALSAGAVKQLLHKQPAAARAADRWRAASAGNPMLLTALLAGGGVDGAEPSLPATSPLWHRIGATIAALPEPTRAFLRSMSLFDAHPGVDLIGAHAGLDEATAHRANDTLIALGLIDGARQASLMRHVVRGILDETVSPEYHSYAQWRAAMLLHADGRPAHELAPHLTQTTMPAPDWAQQALRTAAESAIARHDVVTALAYLRAALRACPPGSAERGPLLVELAITEGADDHAVMLRHIGQALPLLPDARARATALARIPPTALSALTTPVNTAISTELHALRTMAEPTEQDRRLAQQLEARCWLAGSNDPTMLRAAVARLRNLQRAEPEDSAAHRELTAVLLFCTVLTTGAPAGQLASAMSRLGTVPVSDPANESVNEAVSPLTLASAVATESTAGLEARFDRMLAQTIPHQVPHQAVRLLAQRAFLRMHTGRPAAARSDVLAALELMPQGLVDDWISGGLLSAAASAVPDAELRARTLACCAQLRARDDQGVLSVAHDMLHAASLSQQTPRAALRMYEDCEQRLVRHGWHNPALFPIGSLSASLLYRLGDPPAAVDRIRQEYNRARAWGARVPQGRALRVWGTLTQGRPAMRLLDDAVEMLDGSADPLELARALLTRGSRRLYEGRREGAADVSRAHTIALAAECPGLGAAAESSLGEHHENVLPRLSALAPAERVVVDLVLAGHTNQEIAARLSVTLRAVEKRLTNCYRKLDVPNRLALRNLVT
jgi:DNA-binding CsgD family transcriptional regulator